MVKISLMKIQTILLDEIDDGTDTVVVIDVLRAFTTAAYAFEAGAESIQLVRSVAEALAIRQAQPGMLVMGEVGGLRPDGFDYGNSLTALIDQDLRGRCLVQRTSAGTQGAALSATARHLLAASFVCARATVQYIRSIRTNMITLVVTGSHTADHGDEDRACADYLTALLWGETPCLETFTQRVTQSVTGRRFTGQPGEEFDRRDLENALRVDRCSFAMVAQTENGNIILRPYQFQ